MRSVAAKPEPVSATLHASRVTYERQFRSVFGTASVQLESGMSLILSGDNGAGKTTLLKVLAGILRPTSGILSSSESHFVGHRSGLHPDLTALQNLLFYRRLYGPGAGSGQLQEHCLYALQQLDSESLAHVPVAELSAGQQRRVALSRLFLSARRVWLLDEPFVNLDQHSIDLVLGHVRELLGSGGIAVLASHALGLADLPGSQRLRLPLPTLDERE